MCEADRAKARELSVTLRGEDGIVIKDRSYHFRKYISCFIGSEAVSWLVEKGIAKDRKEAVQLGKNLLDADLIHHVVDEHHFEDQHLFYRFKSDDPPCQSEGVSVTSLKRECGTVAGFVQKKGLLRWYKCYLVLKPGDDTLYEFKTDLDSSPAKSLPLKDASCKSEKNLQLVVSCCDPQRAALRIQVETEDDQLMWLKSFEQSGVTILKEAEEEDLPVASSIFDFQAKTIDGDTISLEKYRGFVTLIVNVASF